MKYFSVFLIVILFWCDAYASDPVELTILHVNDIHSHLLPYPYAESASQYGGMARLATLIENMRDERTVVLNAGDMLVGDLMYAAAYDPPAEPLVGFAEFYVSNLLSFDAFALGNHEFDATPAMLAAVLNHSEVVDNLPPMLCANIRNVHDSPGLAGIIKPDTIVEKNGLRIGIIGFLTDESNMISNPAPLVIDTLWTGDLAHPETLEPKPVYQEMIDDLRARGADLVIALTHLGGERDALLAQTYYGIDIIVGGHCHAPIYPAEQYIAPDGRPVIYVRAGAYMRWLGALRTTVVDHQIVDYSYELIPIHDAEEDPMIAAVVESYKNRVDERFQGAYTNVLKEIPFYLEGMDEAEDGIDRAETNLGNMLTDAMRHATGTHLALETAGTIRQSILAGPNTAADIYRVVGQGFNPLTGEHSLPLVTANVSAFALAGALEFSVSTGGAFFFQVSGISFRYDSSRPAGARLDPASIMIGGEPISLGESYSVTMNAFVASLGVELGFITEEAIQTTGVLMFDALRDYIATQDLHRYETTEGRIVDTSEPITLVSGTITDAIPSPIRLEQNFANPFNQTTIIRYYLDRPSMVTLGIYNTLGQRVATLVSDALKAGMHQVELDASDVQGHSLSSGVYVYRLIITNDVVGSVAKTRSMVLTK